MRSVLIWIGSIVAVAVVVIATVHFTGNFPFMGNRVPVPPPAKQSHWIVAPPRPDLRAKAQVMLRKDFGPWRLTCSQPQTPGKSGTTPNFPVRNFAEAGPVAPLQLRPCQVFILMRNQADPRQMMILGFRYRAGVPTPELSVLYLTLGKPNILYESSGQLVDLDKKQKAKGGFYGGQFASKNPGYQESKAQDVHVQLAGQNLTLPTRYCIRGRCRANYRGADVAGIRPGAKILVRLPGPPKGKPREVDVPSQGLDLALAELRRLSQS